MRGPLFKTRTVLVLIPGGNSIILLGALKSSELPVPERLKTAGLLIKNKQKGKNLLICKQKSSRNLKVVK